MAERDKPSAAGEPHAAPAGTFAPFRYPAFRSIWTANLVSQLGSMIQSIAAAWLMTDLTRSHTLIAAIQASATLPILLLGVFAGAIADNYDRRRVMLAAQTGMLLCSALLAVLTMRGLIGPYGLLALTLAVGTGTALNAPAWQASVRIQVGPRDLPQAISLNTLAVNLGRSVGPAFGGLLVAAIGVGGAFALNAVSYLALIVVLLRWRPAVAPPVRQPMLPAIRAGLAFCAGSVAGALVVTALRRRIGAEAVVRMGGVAFAIAILALALVDRMALLFPFVLLGGVAFTFCFTTINVAMQVRSPEAILGRCMAIYQAVSFGGMAIGAWLWGGLADLAGSPVSFGLAAGFLLVASLLLGLLAPLPGPTEGVMLRR